MASRLRPGEEAIATEANRNTGTADFPHDFACFRGLQNFNHLRKHNIRRPKAHGFHRGTATQLQVQSGVCESSGLHHLKQAARICRKLDPGAYSSMPDYNEFLTRIFEILKPFAKQGIILNEDSELVTELGLTSLQVMELIEQIEDHFDMSIPLNILPDIRTVHDLALQLEKLAD
jgi:acyl carrier protein